MDLYTKSRFLVILGSTIFFKGVWLKNGTRGRDDFGLKSCAILESKKSASGAIKNILAMDLSRKTLAFFRIKGIAKMVKAKD